MRYFHCQDCGAAVFFENVRCLTCGHELGFLPALGVLSALLPAGDGRWLAAADGRHYRKCRHFLETGACNWMVEDESSQAMCASCRLSRTIPDIGQLALRQQWQRMESAKRRLCYGLVALRLPIIGRDQDPEQGLCFDFLADGPAGHVVTGHQDGVISMNVAEADDVLREQAKARLHETYRTPLGHLRHEIGHHYWNVLIRDGGRLVLFRSRFGDESADYAAAQKRHYQEGPPQNWAEHHISAYASMHPWEDWAETWAHYMHLVDVVEVAGQFAMSVTTEPQRGNRATARLDVTASASFDQLIAAWMPLTTAINSLNRGMGLGDWYPFTVAPATIKKLRCVHEVIHAAAPATARPPSITAPKAK